MEVSEIIDMAKQLAADKNVELEVIMQTTNGKKAGVNMAGFINVYKALSLESKKQPIELMVDKIHSNINSDSNFRSNNTRVTNLYIPKENGPGYTRIKMIYIVKKRFPPITGDGYKIVLATEESFEKFNQPTESSNNDYTRIKARTPFKEWPKAPGWKIDVTAVWGMPWSTQTNYMKKIIEKCFDSWKNSSNELNLSKFNSFEVEAEYIGNYADLKEESIMAVITALNNIIRNNFVDENDAILYKEVANIAGLIGHARIQGNMTVKKVSQAPIELNQNLWKEIFPPLGWFVTDKADGKRTLLHLYEKKFIIISDTIKFIDIENSCPRTIVDCEEVDGKYYIFDILYFKDSNMTKYSFQRRYEDLESAAKYLADITKMDILAKPFNQIPLIVAETAKLDDIIRPPIEKMWNRERPYKVDGLIFNSPDASYLNTKMFKWKPENTIDFLAIQCPAQLLGPAPFLNKEGKSLFLLFVTINYDEYRNLNLSIIDGYEKIFPQYSTRHSGKIQPLPGGGSHATFPIQFSPSFYPRAYLAYFNTENVSKINTPKILELFVDIKNPKLAEIIENGQPLPWELVRIRDDRQTDVSAGGYFGNYISVAESVAQNIINPLPLEGLWKTSHVYFEEVKDPIYNAPTHFNSFVKSKLFIAMGSSKNGLLLDIAAGRGADIGRYSLGNFGQVVAIDNDAAALSELARRKYSRYFKNVPALHTAKINLNSDKNIIEHLDAIGLPTKYDAISCNFAIHYINNLENFVKLIDQLLAANGKFGFTCFDGARINKLLADKKMTESWVALEDQFVKYQLQKMYIGSKLESRGQIINVKLPFSNELYSENLVNIDYLLELFAKKKINVKERRHFSEFIPEFAIENPKDEKRLTKDDVIYNGLYEFVIVERF
jgi:SAM-dependent methyltransferase